MLSLRCGGVWVFRISRVWLFSHRGGEGLGVEAQIYGVEVAWTGERSAAAPYTRRFSGSHSTSTCMSFFCFEVLG